MSNSPCLSTGVLLLLLYAVSNSDAVEHSDASNLTPFGSSHGLLEVARGPGVGGGAEPSGSMHGFNPSSTKLYPLSDGMGMQRVRGAAYEDGGAGIGRGDEVDMVLEGPGDAAGLSEQTTSGLLGHTPAGLLERIPAGLPDSTTAGFPGHTTRAEGASRSLLDYTEYPFYPDYPSPEEVSAPPRPPPPPPPPPPYPDYGFGPATPFYPHYPPSPTWPPATPLPPPVFSPPADSPLNPDYPGYPVYPLRPPPPSPPSPQAPWNPNYPSYPDPPNPPYAPPPPTPCSETDQQQYLLDLYNMTGGQSWTNTLNWGAQIPRGCVQYTSSGIMTVPDHCCWFGVQCCTGERCPGEGDPDGYCSCSVTAVDLRFNNLVGPFPLEPLVKLQCSGKLQVVEMKENKLQGALPPGLDRLEGLRQLGLSSNNLSGDLPPDIVGISTLHLLDLSWNDINAFFPTIICVSNRGLTHFSLANNNIFWNPVDNAAFNLTTFCTSMTTFNVQDNKLEIPFPTFLNAPMLTNLHIGGNNVYGVIPADIAKAFPILNVLSARFNMIQGTIPNAISELSFLMEMDLSDNLISGTIPGELFQKLGGMLRNVNLGNNYINGTIPDSVRYANGLRNLNLMNNSLYGTIPAGMQQQAEDQTIVKLNGNFLHCCGRDFNGNTTVGNYSYYDYNAARLPPFLKFSERFTFTAPLRNLVGFATNNISCPSLLLSDAVDDYINILDFHIDPEYFMFEGCSCDVGFHMVQLDSAATSVNVSGTVYAAGNIPTFTCVPDDPHGELFLQKYPWFLPLVISASVIILTWLFWYTCFRYGTRPAMVQAYINMKKRAVGEPAEGHVTVVVTNIELYEMLMEEAPEAMDQAATIVSNLIRKCCWTCFAHVVDEKEGQFTLVFRDIMDAVTFSLQVQQALMKQPWPDNLFEEFGKPKKKNKANKMMSWIRNKRPRATGTSIGSIVTTTSSRDFSVALQRPDIRVERSYAPVLLLNPSERGPPDARSSPHSRFSMPNTTALDGPPSPAKRCATTNTIFQQPGRASNSGGHEITAGEAPVAWRQGCSGAPLCVPASPIQGGSDARQQAGNNEVQGDMGSNKVCFLHSPITEPSPSSQTDSQDVSSSGMETGKGTISRFRALEGMLASRSERQLRSARKTELDPRLDSVFRRRSVDGVTGSIFGGAAGSSLLGCGSGGSPQGGIAGGSLPGGSPQGGTAGGSLLGGSPGGGAQGGPRGGARGSPCGSPRASPPGSPRASPPSSPRATPPGSPRASLRAYAAVGGSAARGVRVKPSQGVGSFSPVRVARVKPMGTAVRARLSDPGTWGSPSHFTNGGGPSQRGRRVRQTDSGAVGRPSAPGSGDKPSMKVSTADRLSPRRTAASEATFGKLSAHVWSMRENVLATGDDEGAAEAEPAAHPPDVHSHGSEQRPARKVYARVAKPSGGPPWLVLERNYSGREDLGASNISALGTRKESSSIKDFLGFRVTPLRMKASRQRVSPHRISNSCSTSGHVPLTAMEAALTESDQWSDNPFDEIERCSNLSNRSCVSTKRTSKASAQARKMYLQGMVAQEQYVSVATDKAPNESNGSFPRLAESQIYAGSFRSELSSYGDIPRTSAHSDSGRSGFPGLTASMSEGQLEGRTVSALPNVSAGSLFLGLRVGMGIASGHLKHGVAIKDSAVYDLAHMLMEASSGGQILLDETTFQAIKERLEELGAVDHDGLNMEKLQAKKSMWSKISKVTKQDGAEPNAPLLDMGTYVFSKSGEIPIQLEEPERPGEGGGPAEGAVTRESSHNSLGASSTTLHFLDSRAQSCSEISRATSASGAAIEMDRPSGQLPENDKQLHIYQILAPSLAQRAKVFGNKLNIRQEWVCTEPAYFSAPGTLHAPLGSEVAEGEIPPITMLFMIADGGKTFASKFRTAARRTHNVIVQAVKNCLRMVPGGYLCRTWDGDLKYMVAFPSAQTALAWCLIVQECMIYADWPPAATMFWQDERDHEGKLVFRGPRMKMGLCEGSPRSIMPDHLGHADYLGVSINQSARYMDASAHGGQVACEEPFARKAMTVFQEVHDEDDMVPHANIEIGDDALSEQANTPRDSDVETEDLASNHRLPLIGASYLSAVSAHRLGVFKFKGSNEPVNIVHVTTSHLKLRSFPSEPPKGKGGRIAEASGEVMEVDCRLPGIVTMYRNFWMEKRGGEVIIPVLQDNTSLAHRDSVTASGPSLMPSKMWQRLVSSNVGGQDNRSESGISHRDSGVSYDDATSTHGREGMNARTLSKVTRHAMLRSAHSEMGASSPSVSGANSPIASIQLGSMTSKSAQLTKALSFINRQQQDALSNRPFSEGGLERRHSVNATASSAHGALASPSLKVRKMWQRMLPPTLQVARSNLSESHLPIRELKGAAATEGGEGMTVRGMRTPCIPSLTTEPGYWDSPNHLDTSRSCSPQSSKLGQQKTQVPTGQLSKRSTPTEFSTSGAAIEDGPLGEGSGGMPFESHSRAVRDYASTRMTPKSMSMKALPLTALSNNLSGPAPQQHAGSGKNPMSPSRLSSRLSAAASQPHRGPSKESASASRLSDRLCAAAFPQHGGSSTELTSPSGTSRASSTASQHVGSLASGSSMAALSPALLPFIKGRQQGGPQRRASEDGSSLTKTSHLGTLDIRTSSQLGSQQSGLHCVSPSPFPRGGVNPSPRGSPRGAYSASQVSFANSNVASGTASTRLNPRAGPQRDSPSPGLPRPGGWVLTSGQSLSIDQGSPGEGEDLISPRSSLSSVTTSQIYPQVDP